MPETNCVADQPGNMAINFGQGRDYTDASMLIPSWHQHARLALERGDPFEAFIFDWISINGWAERVTDAEKDADWIDALAASDELRSCFTDLLVDERYAFAVSQFAKLWPIFRADQQRKTIAHRSLHIPCGSCPCFTGRSNPAPTSVLRVSRWTSAP